MLYCNDCGRWLAATEMKPHIELHQKQMAWDHTGPHGLCAEIPVGDECRCPDPVLSYGTWICTCCAGTLDHRLV